MKTFFWFVLLSFVMLIIACGDRDYLFECERTATCRCGFEDESEWRALSGCDNNFSATECLFATCSPGENDYVCGLELEPEGAPCTDGVCDGKGTCVADGMGGSGGIVTASGGSGGAGGLGEAGGSDGGGGMGGGDSMVHGRLTVGASGTCFVRDDGTVRCWGKNNFGQLGNGSTVDSNVPVSVSSLSAAARAGAGAFHVCALRGVDGTAHCWGYNVHGQLGDNSFTDKSVPATVSGIEWWTAIAAGGSHSCGIVASGSVKCWGENDGGQLGNGMTGTDMSAPVDVFALTDAVSIALGHLHTCAVLASGAVRCWGMGSNGQLGHTSFASSNVPVVVTGVNDATLVTAGWVHSCALRSGGTVSCWGRNNTGQLGNGMPNDANTPQAVAGISGATTSLSAGNYHTCVVVGGTVKCWGLNDYGQLGNGTTTDTTGPVTVTGISDAVVVAAGGSHTCAANASGTVWCWGFNLDGQLGNGTNTPSTTPVMVQGL